MSLPVLAELHQLYSAADQGAMATQLAKLAVEKSQQSKLEDTRQASRTAPPPPRTGPERLCGRRSLQTLLCICVPP